MTDSMKVIEMRDSARHKTLAYSLVVMGFFVAWGSASAATLLLNDGSVINGDIKTLQNDVYTVETDTLGTVRVSKQNIRSIDYSDGSALGSTSQSASSATVPGQEDLQAMQSRMMQMPNMLTMIQELQSDPAMQAVLSDPEIMNAMASGDFAALMNHPKIIALTNNSKVREIIEEVH